MVVVALETFGVVVLAVIVVVPTATAVTGTVTDLAFWAMVTDAGTVTMPVWLALKFTVMGEGAGADRFNVTFCVAGPVMVIDDALKLRAAATFTA
jgi:hypothetical protein